jgi:hypothetical protein
MNDNWRYTAHSITKYNPIHRDAKGHYTKNEWIGFFQIGQIINGKLLTFEEYSEFENKYIEAAYNFFRFHSCDKILLKNLEKHDISTYNLKDKDQLFLLYDKITDDQIIEIENLGLLVRLILRELAWAELFCSDTPHIALRFGYDFYMYFNSNRDMTELFAKVQKLGLYVD